MKLEDNKKMKKYTKREKGEFEDSSSSSSSLNNIMMNQIHKNLEDDVQIKIRMCNHEFYYLN